MRPRNFFFRQTLKNRLSCSQRNPCKFTHLNTGYYAEDSCAVDQITARKCVTALGLDITCSNYIIYASKKFLPINHVEAFQHCNRSKLTISSTHFNTVLCQG